MNDGVNLFTLDLEDTRMTTDQDHTTFSSSKYSDVLDASVGDTSGTDIGDIPLERISFADYLDIPNKTNKGKKTNWFNQPKIPHPRGIDDSKSLS